MPFPYRRYLPSVLHTRAENKATKLEYRVLFFPWWPHHLVRTCTFWNFIVGTWNSFIVLHIALSHRMFLSLDWRTLIIWYDGDDSDINYASYILYAKNNDQSCRQWRMTGRLGGVWGHWLPLMLWRDYLSFGLIDDKLYIVGMVYGWCGLHFINVVLFGLWFA